MKKVVTSLIILVMIFSLSLPASASGQTIEELANSVQLKPIGTGSSALDTEVNKVLNKIITPNMTQYQKLVAIYNYCVTAFTYNNGDKTIYMDDVYAVSVEGKPLLDAITNYEALIVLQTRIGVCDHYSAAFVALTNAVGFESHAVTGNIWLNSGRWNAHAWSLLNLGGTYFVFDTQAEQYNIRNGQIRYINFARAAYGDQKYVVTKNVLEQSIQRRNAIVG